MFSATSAAPPVLNTADIEFFEKKIRPVLVEHCYACHSVASKKQKGGLLLDSREGLRKGGESGPAIVPGKPDNSLLIEALHYTDDALKMPPKGKLSDGIVADLTAWVKMGAPDPRENAASTTAGSNWNDILASRRTWWSLQPVRKAEPPAVKNANWSADPVDRFILATLEKVSLQPGEAADPRTMVRRLHFVLTGLPPRPEDVERFVQATSRIPQAAIADEVDHLLASPHFGERWARHWMDVVRFTETHGNEWNYEVHHAWRYRDYLIRAFNDDVPFDRFVREHLAGDLLPPRWNKKEQINESPIGTAFYRFGEVNHDDCIEFRQIGFDLIDNQIDTLSKAFQGTTIACARCHDHKIDAVSMKDYYGLLGILRSSRLVSHTIDAPEVNQPIIQRLRELKLEIRKELADHWLRETPSLAKQLETVTLDKIALDNPLYPLASCRVKAEAFAAAWKSLETQATKENHVRSDFNAKNFIPFGELRSGSFSNWQAAGQALQGGPSPSADFVVPTDGDKAVGAIFPAGVYTHTLSEKLNGALRSPAMLSGKKRISFRVLGDRYAALRLVSNNCQLNYKNFRYLKNPNASWMTFDLPDDIDGLRVYAELMTKLDNPKWPDQLATLSAGDANQRVPMEQAATDPRSYFGITGAVLHDGPEPPRDELPHLRRLFAPPPPRNSAELIARYAATVTAAIRSWSEGRATDDDVFWLEACLRHGLLANSRKATPQLDALLGRYRDVEKQLLVPRITPGLGDGGPGFDQPVFVRGDCRKPGEPTARRYLEVLQRPGEPFASHGSGRLELADRIANRDNPLTARVFVNRVWHHLFGHGLVRTTDDFGRMGDPPSHPELLDFLAARFVEEGWSTKRLIRTLVLTRTFQMTSKATPAATEVDPLNRLLHHYPAHRLEAEGIRDAMLATSGRLDRSLYGPSIQPYRIATNADRRLFPGPLDGLGRRSVYIKANLMESPKFLGVFDLPGGKIAQGRRDVTNVPAQALAMLNDPFVLQQASVWADRLLAGPESTIPARLDRMFQTALGRPPENEERQRFAQAVIQFADLHGVKAAEVMKNHAVWQDMAHAVFNVKEFVFVR